MSTLGRRRAQKRWLGASLMCGLLAFVVVGCGISLSAERRESEIFKDLVIQGEPIVGESLSLILEYEQPYPVAIDVACDLLEEKRDENEEGEDDEPRRVSRILRESLPGNPKGGPLDEATPVSDTIQRSFDAPERPGRYIVLCFTREDEDNTIARLIAVAPAPTSIPP